MKRIKADVQPNSIEFQIPFNNLDLKTTLKVTFTNSQALLLSVIRFDFANVLYYILYTIKLIKGEQNARHNQVCQNST